MKTYNFTIIASGLDPTADDFEARFAEAGCDDATIAFQKGVTILEFAREARSFGHALFTAIKDVLRAGARIEHIEPDCLVSLSEIAQRAGHSRAAISLFAKGERQEGFPAPVARVTTESPLWDWVEVASWMLRKRKISREAVLQAKMVRDANRAIEAGGAFEETPFASKIRQKLHAA